MIDFHGMNESSAVLCDGSSPQETNLNFNESAPKPPNSDYLADDLSISEQLFTGNNTILDESFNSNELTSVLPWDRFSSWIHCICIVTFDLEVGQAIEVSERLH